MLVDGLVAQKADWPLQGGETITLEGRRLERQKYVYLMLNKPQGVVSASQDKRDLTVTDLVRRLFPGGSFFPPAGWTKPVPGLCCSPMTGCLPMRFWRPGGM